MYESDDEQYKREFYYHESNNNKKNNIENDDSMSRYTFVRYVVWKALLYKVLPVKLRALIDPDG